MADTKTTGLTATTTVASSDIVYVVDGGNSRQATVANMSKGVLVTNLDVTGLTASQVLQVNGAGNAIESSGLASSAIVTLTGTQTLTNKTLTTPVISSISNSGTITVPTGTDTLVGRATTDTLTNKTLTTPTIGDLSNATHDHSNNANGGALVAASTTVSGGVELATIAETDTGTDATRAVTPDGLQGSIRNLRFLYFDLIKHDIDVATETSVGGDFPIPFDGTIVQDDSFPDYFAAYTTTAGTTGTMVVDVHLNGTTIMTTNKLDIESTEKDTTTAATQPDLTTTDVSAGDILTFDIDAVHTTAAQGLRVVVAIRPD